ncbi:MAG: TPM domain-containing protein [Bacteroidales bacterium]|nr:TPM domain-containing protein [Bacteroidales bacterium]
MSSIKKLLSDQDQQIIVAAIREAEKNTSGEIRVHIETSFKGDILDQASHIFKKLKMHKTQLRNGVLFYLAVKNRKFAILGDVGINQKVPENFWDQIKETMIPYFRDSHFAEGLSRGIKMAGEKLKAHFPYQQDDVNELSDEISFGK